MEYEEALKLFKDHDYWAEISYIDEACITAIPALEKQIPKKPIKIKVDNDVKYTCRMCDYIFPNEIIEVLVKREGHDLIFCPHCGQAIDWSKV